MFLQLIAGEPEMCYAALKRFAAVNAETGTTPAASGVVSAAYQIDLDHRGWSPLNIYEGFWY